MPRKKSGISAKEIVLLFSLIWSVIGLLLAILYSPSDWQATLGVLMVNQAFCGAIAWNRFKKTATAILPDFLSLYLFMQFLNKLLSALAQVVKGNSESTGKVGEHLSLLGGMVVPEYMYQAEWVFLVATIIFTFVWYQLERKKIKAVWQEPTSKATWWVYALSLSTYLALSVSAIPLGMTQNLMWLFSIGAIAILLSGHTNYALGKKRSLFAILALIPLYVIALRSGMKGEIVMVSLPILIPVFRHMTLVRFIFFGGFIVFVVLFVFPFSMEWRMENWFGSGNASIIDVATQVFMRWEHVGILETASESMAQWLSRKSTSEQGGLVMQIAEKDGLIGAVLIEGLATIFIPRFLWPDKPLYQPGGWFTWYLGRADSPETATSSTAMMLPTELYWMFGITGVILGMVLLSMLYFYVWRYLLRRAAQGIVSLFALFALLSMTGKFEETHVIYAVSSPIIMLIYISFFEKIQRYLFPKLSQMTKIHGEIK